VTGSLTDRLQQSRLMIVEVDREGGRLRVRGAACTDLSCHARTVVVTEDGSLAGVDALNPGDIVRIEEDATEGGVTVARVVVLRRVWERIASPEL
jgi:hypothetical protein